MRKISEKARRHLAKKTAKGQNRWIEPKHKKAARLASVANRKG